MKYRRLAAAALACAVMMSGCGKTENAPPPASVTPADTPEQSADTSVAHAGETSGTAGASGTSDIPGTPGTNTVGTSGTSAADSTAASQESTAATAGTTSGTTSGTQTVTEASSAAGTAAAQTTSSAPTVSAASKYTANGGYEGKEQTSTFNYGEALQKSLIFYDLQRSGDLPDDFRCNWRGDSCLNDGKDNGLDLSGGFFDAGDNVKFNLPMSYTTALLAWSVYEDRDAYRESGQLDYILDTIRWGNDYFIKCHPEANVYYYQVGDGNADHGWWGPAETVETQMKRPSYKVDLNNPGSTVTACTAASLAACAVVFKDSDSAYSQKCVKHAKELYAYAEKVKSDSGYTAANGFYQSFGGFNDDLAFAAFWLYKATGEEDYLKKAKDWFHEGDPNWALCWDDKSWGTAVLLANETGSATYRVAIEKHLDYWLNEIHKTPKGLAYCDQWGALRYATTTAFVALSYVTHGKPTTEDKAEAYKKFAKSQIDYALGSTGRSFVCGYGENPPVNPHHRTAHGSYTNNIGDPATNRHVLYGALVGGPGRNDEYSDDRNNYVNNEVACDYNAGFTGALVKLWSEYGGKTLKNFGAIETPDEELYTDAAINVNGQDFIEIKALVYNKTAYPARNTDDLRLCYFFDISEVLEAGGSPSDLTVTTNYMQGGSASDVLCWNKDKNLYYVAIDFTGTDIYPGGQDTYKKEVQFRIRNTKGVWDNSNDPSYIDIGQAGSGTMVKAQNMALYEGSVLVFGTEPNEKNTGDAIKDIKPSANVSGGSNNNNSGGNSGSGYTGSGTVNNVPAVQVSDKGTVSVSLEQQQASGKGNTIGFSLKIKNTGSTGIDLSRLTADYFFTNDGGGDVVFECDYADIQGSTYQAVTDNVSGSFSDASGDKTDTKCTIKSSGTLAGGDTLTINVRIHKSDWTEMDLGNDLSGANADNVTVTYNGKKL